MADNSSPKESLRKAALVSVAIQEAIKETGEEWHPRDIIFSMFLSVTHCASAFSIPDEDLRGCLEAVMKIETTTKPNKNTVH